MAATAVYVVEYLGTVEAIAGETYTTASILASFPTANVVELVESSKGINTSKNNSAPTGVGVSISGTPMFLRNFGDRSYLATGHTYLFKSDCLIAVGIMRAIT